jgi:hypothetical protein
MMSTGLVCHALIRICSSLTLIRAQPTARNGRAQRLNLTIENLRLLMTDRDFDAEDYEALLALDENNEMKCVVMQFFLFWLIMMLTISIFEFELAGYLKQRLSQRFVACQCKHYRQTLAK